MDICEAAVQLEQAVRAYSARTPEGAFRVPLAAQRPIYLFGPPGVGKSAIVAQVAQKLGIGFAAYSMTHHTRQSALGLPLIVHKTFEGEDRAVTEYTASEIVANVWEKVEAGARTGLLFLDEINCVSESLMPAMLQLLQYKTFGVHALPRGWMIVCAGNPPKYNRYARTFDAVVMDRLRVIEIEPDLPAWRAYAAEQGVHSLIRSYLTLRGEDFYVTDGDRIVTARSWTDLSELMLALEAEGITPTDALFSQYLQVEAVAGRFARYCRLCADIGTRLEDAVTRQNAAPLAELPFDEAVFAALMLSHRIQALSDRTARLRRRADSVGYFIEGVFRDLGAGNADVEAVCLAHVARLERARAARLRAGSLGEEESAAEAALIEALRDMTDRIHGASREAALSRLNEHALATKETAEEAELSLQEKLTDLFDFAEAAFGDPNVRLVFANDLSAHEATRRLIEKYAGRRMESFREKCDPSARAGRLNA